MEKIQAHSRNLLKKQKRLRMIEMNQLTKDLIQMESLHLQRNLKEKVIHSFECKEIIKLRS